MKGAIVYISRYGATRKYAEMLSEELNIPAVPADKVTAGVISQFDYLLIGSPVYVGKLLLGNFLNMYKGQLKWKKIFLFIVSADIPGDPTLQPHIISNTIPPIILPNTQVIFLRGKVIYKKLSLRDKLLLRMGAMQQKFQERNQLRMADFDEVKKENITVLINAVKTMLKTPEDKKCMQVI